MGSEDNFSVGEILCWQHNPDNKTHYKYQENKPLYAMHMHFFSCKKVIQLINIAIRYSGLCIKSLKWHVMEQVERKATLAAAATAAAAATPTMPPLIRTLNILCH